MTVALGQELADRLIRYCRIDTQADEASPTTPSTVQQFDLLNLLVEELTALGAADVRLTDYGAVLATLPATVGRESAPTIAFLAHVDTSPGYYASGVKPMLRENYDGGDLTFPDNPALVLSPDQFPYLATQVGNDLITASGGTLLGADDKAGVAIIMALAHHLLTHPEVAHGAIRVCFTPDEEIGRGVHPSLPADLAAEVAYTLDGADRGEVVYETFSADKATVRITGVSAHPGQSKDVMVNALHLAAKIIMTLPHVTRTPEVTEGRDGFIHLYHLEGGAAEATLEFILRDFEREGLAAHGALLTQVCETVAASEPRARITCVITKQYRNMRYWLEDNMRPVDLALAAATEVGLTPFSPPTRGGTDGSRLTELGVPTPNLFTGMQNFHGPLEWVSVQDMVASTELCLALAGRWAVEAEETSAAG